MKRAGAPGLFPHLFATFVTSAISLCHQAFGAIRHGRAVDPDGRHWALSTKHAESTREYVDACTPSEV